MIATDLPVRERRAVDGPVRPPSTVRPGVPARPARAAGSSRRRPRRLRPAYCPHPVASRRSTVGRAPAWIGRAVAATGVVLASAAAVVGLGLLADASAPQVPSTGAPAPVMLDASSQ